MKADYYEEDKKSKGMSCCEENEYSKWRVESALTTLQDAQKILADTKMTGYVKKYLAHKKAQDAAITSQLNVETKVGKKLKEVFSG